jgi:isopentenyl phosphate kinase
MEDLVFLKLGGSLITEKLKPRTPRRDVLERLAAEIASMRKSKAELKVLIGHGSGSFGHIPANKYGTRQGVRTPAEKLGFAEVWKEAAALNHLVTNVLIAAGLPIISLPASASVVSSDGRVAAWDLTPLLSALQMGLVPVIYGDVIFDQVRGGTILSTEDLFRYLAPHLRPQRLLLAGLEEGVWADFPARTRLIAEITPQNLEIVSKALGKSAATDVTGGMEGKVNEMLKLVREVTGLDILIFSGEKPGSIAEALSGKVIGTWIHGFCAEEV